MAQLLSEFLNTAFSTYTENDAFNNSVVYPITLTHTTTGTPANGIGTGLKFITETSAGNNEIGGLIDVVTTDVTSGSEDFDFVFKNMAGGASASETLRISSIGDLTTAGDLTVGGGQITLIATSGRDKYRLWNNNTYTIGLENSVTYGAVNNEKAMTFQMSNTNAQGFWWGDSTHTTAQGAMALSTDGKLTIAHSARIGYGESDTTLPGATFKLDVNGGISATNIDFGNVDIGVSSGFESWNHNSNSFDASVESTDIGDIFIVGSSYIYLSSLTAGHVYKYTFITTPNISTANYIELLDTNSEDSQISGVFLKSDGTELYATGYDNSYVYQYSLSTGNNLSTASFNQSFDVSSEDTLPSGVVFNTTGTKMFVLGQENNKVFEYSLSSGWDISTATYSQNFDLAGYTTTPTAIRFSNDGTILYILDKINDAIFKFDVATPFDVSTSTLNSELDISTIGLTETVTNPTGMFIDESANRLYVVDKTENTVYEYSTATESATVSGSRLIVQNDIHVKGDTIVYHNANIHGRLQALSATVEGNITLNGNINTSNTVTIADTATSITIGATSGTTTVRNNLSVTQTATVASAVVSDLTEGRIVVVGASGALTDNVGLTWDGSTLSLVGDIEADNILLTANIQVDGDVNVSGTVNGNATSADAWSSIRTVTFATGDVTGSFNIDGSGNVDDVVLSIAANSVTLGTDTTGNYMAGISAAQVDGTDGITVTHTPGEGSTATIAHANTSSVSNVTLTANNFVDEVTFDTYGHVITIGTTAVDFNVSDNYAFKSITDGTNTAIADSNADTFKFRSGDQIEVTVTSDDATHGDSILIGHADSGVVANTYGSTTAIPVITIDAQGHITNASTSSISTTWTISDGSNTQAIDGGNTLVVSGGTLLTSVVSATDTLTINHDSVSRSDTTSSASPSHGGTFDIISSVTTSTEGHVTAVDVKTITLPSDNNTTYDLTVPTSTTAIRLAGSDATNDDITITGSGATTVTRTSATELTISSTDNNTTYAISAETGGKLRLTGSDTTTDDVTFVGAGIASVATTDANTITITATEADTLSSVTGRGATTATAVSITNSTASSGTGTGALIVTGGVGIGGALNVGGSATITGNLTVNGTTTTVNSTITTIDDPIITLGGDTAPSSDDNKDRGIEFRWHNGTSAKVGFFGFDDSTGKFTFIPDGTNTSEVFSGTKGTLDANIEWSDILNVPTYDNYSSWTLSDGSTTQTISSGNTVVVSGGTLLTSVVSATDTVTINHDSVSRTDTTSTSSPSHGGTFTVVDSVTSSTEGHVTAINVKTITLPSDNNTTYSISTEAGGDAYSEIIRLTDSSAVTDDITLAVGAVDTVYGLTISETGDIITFAHADTSSASNLSASSRTYVSGLTFDTYGHVTAYTTATETVTDTNTTYSISGETATGGANLRLTGSDASTDDVKIASGTNVTVTRTDANTITISSTDTNTTYGISAETGTGGVNLRLTDSGAVTDDVLFAEGSNITLTRTDANTITIASSYTDTNTTYSISTEAGGDAYSEIIRLTDSSAGTDDITLAVEAVGGVYGLTISETGDIITFAHADTSSASNVTAATNTWVSGLTFDTYGHVTATTTGTPDFNVSGNYAFTTITVSDTDSGSWAATGSAVADSNADTLTLIGGTGINIDVDTTNDRIRITNTVTDTDTTYDISASSTTGGANLDLNAGGSGSGTDSVKFASGTNVTVAYTDANTITISSTDTNTTYSAGTGLSLSGTTFNHSNSVTASTASEGGATRTLAYGGTFNIPSVTYDAQGHITAKGSVTLTLPASDNTNTTYSISSETGATGAYLRLTDSSAATDDVEFVGSGIATVTSTDANTITITATEADTLATVTGRGATTATAVSITNATNATSTSTGALIVTGGVGIGGDLFVGGGDISAGNVATTLLGGNTTTAVSFATAQTSGALTIGGTAQTGTITIDRSASAHTLNIATGVNTSGTKTVNIATGSSTTGVTALTLGSTNSTSSTIIQSGSGKVRFNIGAATLYLPTADGSAGQVLKTDGAGNLSFDSVDSLSGGIASIVEDTGPQLGGDLDVNGFSIVSEGGGNILITPDTTGYIQLDGLKWPTSDGSNGYLLATDGAGQLSWTAAGSNTTYTVSVPSNGVIRLTGSDASTDDVTIAGGTDISLSSASDTITVNNTSTLSTVTGRGATTATAVSITNSTGATSTSTGALIVTGGVGIGGALYVGGNEVITGDLTVSGGDITAGNVASTLFAGNTTTATTWGGGLTSGALTIGGTATTGTITFDRSASAHTLNIATGTNASGVTKTINFGTGGASGSTTAINIGSSTSGATTNTTIYGNLTVQGTTTYVNTQTLNVSDNIITLNYDFTSDPPTEDAGVEIERGSTAPNVQLIWNETTDRWAFTNDGSTFYNIPLSTEYDNYGGWTLYMDGTTRGTVSSGEIVDFVSANTGSTAGISLSYSTTNNNRISIAHADTSSLSGAQGSAGIASITVDEMGHVTAVTTATYLTSQANNFATVAITHTDSGYTWGTAGTNTNQTADSATDTLTIVRGLTGSTSGIDLFTNTVAGTDAIKIAHADTSTLSGAQGSAGIASITVDEMGHVTAVTTATYLTSNSSDFATITVTDTDSGYTWAATGSAVADSVGDTLTLVSGGAIDIDVDATSDAIRISHSDTSALTGAQGSAGISSITVDGYGHVTAVSTATYLTSQSNNFATVAIGADAGYTWNTANTNTNQTADSSTDTITIVRGLTGSTAGIDLYANTVAGTDAIKIAHADTSTLSGAQGSAGIASFTVDEMGHVTAVTTATYLTSYTETQTLQDVTDLGATSTNQITLTQSDSGTNTVLYPLVLVRESTGTPANSIGTGIQFVTETTAGNNEIGATIEAVVSDVTAASEDFSLVFKTMAAGAAASTALTLTSTGSATLVGDLTVSGGDITAGNVASTLFAGNTTTATTWGGGLTSGALTIGGTATTGTITFDRSASAHTVNYSTGANASAVTKTINFGTGGAAGSTTNITVGSSGGGTLTVNSPNTTFNQPAAGIFTVQATAAPTSDMAVFTNAGQAVTTAGVNALNVTYVGGAAAVEASAMRIDLTPGGTSGGTWTGLRLTQGAATATGVTVNVLKADSITAGAGTDNVLYVGTGYDSIVNYNGTVVIDGSGQVVAAQIASGTAGISITGNAATATKWATGRTITLTGDVTGVSGSFDGSGNLSFATTIAANSVALGTDTTGNYVAGATAGNGIAITGTAGEGWSPTIAMSGSYTGTFTATGDICAYSDITLKENVEIIADPLEKVLKLRGVTFTRKDLEDDKTHMGVIAQEVEEVIPEVVITNEDGLKTVAYGNMVALLIEAIKELTDQNKELLERVAQLENKIQG